MQSPLRILIVQKTDADLRTLQHELERGGYVLDSMRVESAAMLKKHVFKQSWDLILSDYETDSPFSGREALAALKESGMDIPFIVVSRSIGEEAVAEALRAGAHDFLLKDNLARLVQVIERERSAAAERRKAHDAEAQIRSYNQRLVALHAIDQAILNDADPETICTHALKFLGTQMGLWRGEVALLDMITHEARVMAVYRRSLAVPKAETGERYSLDVFKPDVFGTLASGLVHSVPRVTAGEFPPVTNGTTDRRVASFISVPITLKGLVGVMTLLSDKEETFVPEFVASAVEIAHQLAVAIRQGRFAEQIQRSSAELEQRVSERTKELQYATHRSAAILNNTSDAIIVTDGQGRIRETNPAFRELFGYHRDTMIGFGVSQMFDLDQKPLLEESLKAAVTFGTSDNIEVTGVRADGTHFEADIAVVSIMENGTLENIVYSVRDITRRKLVEQELRVMLDQQRELNELKSRFVSMASHEFRTPLAIIRTTTDMLGAYRSRMDEKTIDMRLDKIRSQITHLAALMDDVLTLARDQAGKSAFDPEPGDFDAFCRDLVDEFTIDPDLDHPIAYSCTPQPLNIQFDRTLMRKAIYNLLSNALKYSPPGSAVSVSISQSDNLATIRVRDEGVGIPEADQKRLFEAFHRGSNVGSVSGTGLGLTITKQSIEAHGGSLRFESKLNEGTTFIATIPAKIHSTEGAL